jgi:hypothetical protein
MKKILALIGGLIAFSLHGQSTVNFSAAPGQRDVVSDSGVFPVIGTASVGFFDGGVWRQYGITDIRQIFGEPSRFAGTASATDPVFVGERIILRIDTPTALGGLYTSSLDSWVFPDHTAVPPANTTSINSSQVTQAFYGSFDADHLIIVPEPSPLGCMVAGFLFYIVFWSWKKSWENL